MNSLSHRLDETTDEDPLLCRAAQEYLAELEAGRRPRRAEFAARFPHLGAELIPYLDAIDMMHGPPPTLPGMQADAAETLPAEPLGDFRIVREIGRGGMGVVYEAVQLSLGRRVALKVLAFAAALDPKQLQRFKNEAQAAAQLHHTNIVPVYAVGCERGTHFYAMQLIEGQNLADLIRHLQPGGANPASAASTPALATSATAVVAELSTKRMSRSDSFFRAMARLVVQATEALEHAHELGVVHRDVKPANLLVDAVGNVWVTDFGLAQFHTGVGLTRSGDLLGTLRYMSPEQAAGQGAPLDARTDVYSLGATLYELLTLEPMFGGSDYQRLLRQILNDEPRPPRALERSVPAELETIVLKAVSKNPVDRYDSARAFGDDLRRFVDNLPIQARRPTIPQRVRKWALRHPSVVAAAIVLLIILTAGSLIAAGIIRGEQEKTRKAYEQERRRADEAEQRFQLALRSADDLIQLAEELADNPQMEGMRKRLLDVALENYQEFIEQRRDQPDAQSVLAVTRDQVKKILGDLSALKLAGQLSMLRNPDMLGDLALTADQRDRLKEFQRKEDKGKKTVEKLAPQERKEGFLELARTLEADVASILTPAQLRRLGQVALQARGPMAIREPTIAAALKLTTAQKDQIRTIEWYLFTGKLDGDYPGKFNGPPGPWHGHRQNPPPEIQAQARRVAAEKIQAVLTEDQRVQWQKMIGAPFKGSIGIHQGGPGVPPR